MKTDFLNKICLICIRSKQYYVVKINNYPILYYDSCSIDIEINQIIIKGSFLNYRCAISDL